MRSKTAVRPNGSIRGLSSRASELDVRFCSWVPSRRQRKRSSCGAVWLGIELNTTKDPSKE
jgi:hypothetical protein